MSKLYSDGRHYDFLLGDQMDDVAYYVAAAKEARGPILELACGTGRLTLPIAAAGCDITGLDLSEPMLIRAREKAEAAKLKVPFVQGNATYFDLKRKFKLIFFPYNSMSHLHERSELETMLACVRRHLEPGGRFLLDVHHPNLDLLKRRPGEIYPVEGLSAAPDGTVVTGEEVFYDEARQVYKIRWHYSSHDGKEPRIDELNLRMFFAQELDALLHFNGFKILKKYGDFKKKPFEAPDGKQILVCEI